MTIRKKAYDFGRIVGKLDSQETLKLLDGFTTLMPQEDCYWFLRGWEDQYAERGKKHDRFLLLAAKILATNWGIDPNVISNPETWKRFDTYERQLAQNGKIKYAAQVVALAPFRKDAVDRIKVYATTDPSILDLISFDGKKISELIPGSEYR